MRATLPVALGLGVCLAAPALSEDQDTPMRQAEWMVYLVALSGRELPSVPGALSTHYASILEDETGCRVRVTPDGGWSPQEYLVRDLLADSLVRALGIHGLLETDATLARVEIGMVRVEGKTVRVAVPRPSEEGIPKSRSEALLFPEGGIVAVPLEVSDAAVLGVVPLGSHLDGVSIAGCERAAAALIDTPVESRIALPVSGPGSVDIWIPPGAIVREFELVRKVSHSDALVALLQEVGLIHGVSEGVVSRDVALHVVARAQGFLRQENR